MAYTVLARKYRSKTFDDIVGQQAIATTLKNAIKFDRLAHAFLFVGTRGVGKTTMARVLAKNLNCLNFEAATTEACCKCDSCMAVNIGEDLDVIEIDGASNNGVEQVRELRQNAIYRPARSRFKIYIIDEVHMLSTGAFNALLKILEEPPAHVKFIFATTEPNKVIPTIQSRCQRFDFSNISPALIAEHLENVLKEEKIDYQQDLVLHLAKMANGSMRDALSLLDRLISTGGQPLTVELLEEFLGCPNSEKIYKLISEIGDSNAERALTAIEDLINSGLNEIQIVDAIVDSMRDLMVVKSAGPKTKLLILTDEQRKRASELAEKFDIAGIVYSITTLEKLRWSIKNSDTGRALLEASILRFALSEHFMNVDELLGQLANPTSRPVKKNKIADSNSSKPRPEPEPNTAPPAVKTQSDLPKLCDLDSIKDNWQKLMELITNKLGNGTAVVFSPAQPAQFENGILTLIFDSSARVSKEMCETNGRVKQIESLLKDTCGEAVRLKLEVADNEQDQPRSAADRPSTIAQKKDEIVSDPAVKTVLMGLGATITDIDENRRN